MTAPEKNSLDLLRLVAALLVLCSHQFALMGQPEPSFFGWASFGGAGITIFFLLSCVLAGPRYACTLRRSVRSKAIQAENRAGHLSAVPSRCASLNGGSGYQ